MSSIVQTYRPTLIFIGKFVLTYTLMVGLYNWYLSQFHHTTDFLTGLVGKSVDFLYKLFGINSQSLPLDNEPGLKLIIEGEYIARIVEGCTAISVIIMFVAFIISFGNNLKKALLFCLLGGLSIFIFNLFRIVILGYMLYIFPQYQDVAHRIIFPAMIYAYVVLLWIVFIKKFND